MRVDPAKQRAWQARGVQQYQEKRRKQALAGTKPRQSRRKPRRNDGPWRDAVMARYGEWCRACGSRHRVQADHMMPRGQGGPSVVENGLPLCESCHEKKTNSRIVIEFEWLDESQIAWLADVGWCWWDDDGEPHGRGYRHFGPRKVLGLREKGGTDG